MNVYHEPRLNTRTSLNPNTILSYSELGFATVKVYNEDGSVKDSKREIISQRSAGEGGRKNIELKGLVGVCGLFFKCSVQCKCE